MIKPREISGQDFDESEADKEALDRIRELREMGSHIIERLFPDIEKELFDPVREKYHNKYPDIDFDLVDDDEFPSDYGQALEEVGEKFDKIVKSKSDEEILARAKELYELQRRDDNLTYAYSIAKDFLDQMRAKIVAQEILRQTWQEMKEAKQEDKIKYAETIISRHYPETERDEEMVEEALEVLLESDRAKKEPRYAYRKLRYFAEKWGLPKIEKVYNFASPFAREEIEALISKGEVKEALERAEDYEKIGFLNLELDSDLFEKLTE